MGVAYSIRRGFGVGLPVPETSFEKLRPMGFATNKKNMWNKLKNHFSEMKRDVGMLLHEKEGEQEDA